MSVANNIKVEIEWQLQHVITTKLDLALYSLRFNATDNELDLTLCSLRFNAMGNFDANP